MTPWELGIDPGMTETGLVLTKNREPVAWTTFSCVSRATPMNRAMSLADDVVNWIVAMITLYDIEDLSIAIEMPIYNANPKGYELQFRLVQQIEEGLVMVVAGLLVNCELIEFKPDTSKKLSTGNGHATKDDIVAVMPDVIRASTMELETCRTLADAWAHSLVARTNEGINRTDLTTMRTANVHQNMEART